jgi:Xaa-Pro dipeptidase
MPELDVKKIPNTLPFDVGEFERRQSKARELLVKAGADALLVVNAENIYYLTGYRTIGLGNYANLIFSQDQPPILILRFLEQKLAEYYSCVQHVVTWDDTDDPLQLTRDTLQTAKLLGRRLAIERDSAFLTVRTYEKLVAALGNPQLIDGSSLIGSLRLVKSPAEIDLMRRAAAITSKGIQAAVEATRAGATENDVAAAAFATMVKGGSDYMATDPIVTSGFRAGIPHTSFGNRVLERDDTVLMEFGANVRRYFGPLMRTAFIGEPSAEVERMAAVTIESLNAAIAAVKPGVTSGEVDAACREVITRAGYYEYFRKRTGYSVGSGFPPTWSEAGLFDLKKDDPRPLQAGMVFHIPPALRKYGELAVGFSETMLVTEKGCEILTDFPRTLALCPD